VLSALTSLLDLSGLDVFVKCKPLFALLTTRYHNNAGILN